MKSFYLSFCAARQQEAEMSPILNYEEITPCLRDVTKEWEDMINDHNRPHIQFNHQTLLKCVQQGMSIHVFILFVHTDQKNP